LAESSSPPIIFLLGPPGVGKSTLGRHACKELGLEFLDLAATSVAASGDGEYSSNLAGLSGVIADRTGDVVEFPWPLQHERQALVLARRSGVPLLLWAHPEDMQARSGYDEPLFTPVPRLKVRGGFGRNGTGCREFRRVDRACEETLLLVDLPFQKAAEYVRRGIQQILQASTRSPAEREGIAGWVEHWRQDHSASPHVSKLIVDAMARYLSHLRARGTSPRKLSGIYSDLNAAGHLVLMYDAPKGKRVLEHFGWPPWEAEFRRKFSDSPTLLKRYSRNLDGFARFLKESGEIADD